MPKSPQIPRIETLLGPLAELPAIEALVKPLAEFERSLTAFIEAPAKAVGVTARAPPGPATILLALATGKPETVLAPFLAPLGAATKTSEEKETERRGWGM